MRCPIVPLDVPEGSTLPVNHSFTSRLQTALLARGYDPGPADGIYGPRTATALKRFQEDQGLGDLEGYLFRLIGRPVAACGTYEHLWELECTEVYPVLGATVGEDEAALWNIIVLVFRTGVLSNRCAALPGFPKPPGLIDRLRERWPLILVGTGLLATGVLGVLAINRALGPQSTPEAGLEGR